MNNTENSNHKHLSVIDETWENLEQEHKESLQQYLLRWIDNKCKKQINSGNYNSTVSLDELYKKFNNIFVSGNEIPEKGEAMDITYSFSPQVSNDIAGKLLFQRLIDELIERDVILYVYDKQRVRSRVAEVTRYFALLRQRFADESDFEQSPSLTKMVKMDIQSREKPKWGDQGINLSDKIRDIYSKIKTADPAKELEESNEMNEWSNAAKDALRLIYKLCKKRDMTGLAAFQGRALDKLFRQSITKEYNNKSHVITASTGGGKTEAFLFPILAYTFTVNNSDINLDGVDAVLAYPRKDLCNNQFERLVEYLYDIQKMIKGDEIETPFNSLPISVALQHGDSGNVDINCPVNGCDGQINTNDMKCKKDEAHFLDFAKSDKGRTADIIIVTPDTLHRRLMDHRGYDQFWKHSSPPKFVVLDEVHVYTNQYGMHVANVMRRFKSAISEVNQDQNPCLVASSATISNAEDFTQRIFGTQEAVEIKPRDEKDEIEEIGWEYLVFIKATDPRKVEVPKGEAKYLPKNEWEENDFDETNVTNLSSMIQVAFSMYHTILKNNPESGQKKNKILGFVDSIDSVKRLGDYIHDAESRNTAEGQELFQLRAPDAFLRNEGESGTNPDCPKHKFRSNASDHEKAVCESLPPNKHLNPCPVYEAGECWWTMTDAMDLEPMDVYLHKSGRTEKPNGEKVNDDSWDLMVTTSALEVGFDHPGIIGTFQYRAPMNIPGFVQRKGRGGRDPGDHPISVVVLGSQPEDSFYFHHENLLSDPDERYLRINLDEENEFIRIEHLVSSIFDYLNITDHETADKIYRRLNIDVLDDKLTQEQTKIERWMRTTFPTVDNKLAEDALEEIKKYVNKTQESITPQGSGDKRQAFWKAARIQKGTKTTDLQSQLKDLRFKKEFLQRIIDDDINININE